MANTNEIILTQEGVEQLKKEYRNLIDVERPAVIEALENARAMGDLSENADYDAARNKQDEIEGRINQISAILANAKVVADAGKSKTVNISNTVTYLDLLLNEEFTVKIVSSIESDPISDPNNVKISNVCALGEALVGHKINDEVTVKVNKPYKVKILKIK